MTRGLARHNGRLIAINFPSREFGAVLGVGVLAVDGAVDALALVVDCCAVVCLLETFGGMSDSAFRHLERLDADAVKLGEALRHPLCAFSERGHAGQEPPVVVSFWGEDFGSLIG